MSKRYRTHGDASAAKRYKKSKKISSIIKAIMGRGSNNIDGQNFMNWSGRAKSLPQKTLVYKGGWGRFMPDKFFTYIYEAELWADTTAGGNIDYIIKANSAYDPWDGLSANTMMGFAEMMQMYHQYKVHSCMVEGEVVNNDTDDPVNFYLIPMWTSTTQAARGEESIALPGCQSTMVANQTGSGKLRCYIRMKDVFGVRNLDSEDYAGTSSSDPTQKYYIHWVMANRSGNALNVECKVKITMFIQFYNQSYIFSQ